MAYAAASNLMFHAEFFSSSFGPFFRPPCLKFMEQIVKEMQSFIEFLNGSGVNTRKRMEDSLRQIAEATRALKDELYLHIDGQIELQSEVHATRLLYSLEVESLKPEFHSLFEMMKKMKKERFDGGADSGGNKPKMVGLSDVYNEFKRMIVFDKRDSSICSILGMAGIGKTALAEAIFEDLDMLEWFECRVWVSVGKKCRIEEIAPRILAQLSPDNARKLEEGDGNAGAYLREILKEKRHLIVLDDVWDARFLDHCASLFPTDDMESRVILTSRSRRMIDEDGCVIEMRLLNDKESWDLLREKVFGIKYCSPELENVGKKIAEKCDGLPLTIIVVADHLSKIPESLWIDVATKRKHQLFIDAYNEISKVLYPSYESIPRHLKLCFLYMAVFPPNYKIPRSRITNMWFVEELLEATEAKYSESYANECLEEFFSNFLVLSNEYYIREIDNEETIIVKTCVLHSSWWHLCYTEARKNNFFFVLAGREDCLEKYITSQERLTIHNNILFAIKDVHDSMENNSASSARSLLCLGPYHRYPVSICFGLRFLKNLDTLNIRLYEFPLEVLELGGLKYFSLTCDGELPASISKLRNLQFFIVQQHHIIKCHGVSSYLPVEIWDLKELNHFQIMGSDLLDPPCGAILPNLLTLLDVSGQSCTKNIFESIPNLRRLGIRIQLGLDVVEPLRCFDHISQLGELKILKCVVSNPSECKFGVVSLPTSFNFPRGLRKLTLSGLGYAWEEMSKIASLPCLEVLKLRHTAFRGPKWEVEEDVFTKLKSLEIEDIDLVQWIVGRGSLEVIKSLSIKHCYKLKEVHWVSDVELVDRIVIIDCNPSLKNELLESVLRQGYLPTHFDVESSWEAED